MLTMSTMGAPEEEKRQKVLEVACKAIVAHLPKINGNTKSQIKKAQKTARRIRSKRRGRREEMRGWRRKTFTF